MSNDVLKPGVVCSFEYPRHNFHGVLSYLERRRVMIQAIRDLTLDPLERVTFDIQPLLRRGRFLVIGQDLDKQAERKFYVDSMKGIKVEPKVEPSTSQSKVSKSSRHRKTA